jgi:hypothetical protein
MDLYLLLLLSVGLSAEEQTSQAVIFQLISASNYFVETLQKISFQFLILCFSIFIFLIIYFILF